MPYIHILPPAYTWQYTEKSNQNAKKKILIPIFPPSFELLYEMCLCAAKQYIDVSGIIQPGNNNQSTLLVEIRDGHNQQHTFISCWSCNNYLYVCTYTHYYLLDAYRRLIRDQQNTRNSSARGNLAQLEMHSEETLMRDDVRDEYMFPNRVESTQ